MLHNNDKKFLENQLNLIYSHIKKLPNSKIKGTTEYEILYELETINMTLDIPFKD